MPKHGEVRKLIKYFVHDNKVIDKDERLQSYHKWGGYWSNVDSETRVIEVKDLEMFKKYGKEEYLYYV